MQISARGSSSRLQPCGRWLIFAVGLALSLITSAEVGAPGVVHSAVAHLEATSPSARTRFPTRESRLVARTDLEGQLAAIGPDDPVRDELLIQLSEMDLLLNDAGAAERSANDAVEQARRGSDQSTIIDALIARARAGRVQGKSTAALEQLNEALGLSRQRRYTAGEAGSLIELAPIYFGQGRARESVATGQRALELCRQLADRRCEARALYFLGAPYMALSSYHESVQALQGAAKIWHELGEPYDRAETLLEQNFLEIRQGQWRKALSLLHDVDSLIADPSAEPFLAAQRAMSYGEVHEAYGQLELALEDFQEALVWYRDRAHEQSGEIDARRFTARVEARLQKPEQAEKEIQTALALAKSSKNRFMEALCLEELARVYLSVQQNTAAREQLERAIPIYLSLGRQREAARSRAYLGQALYLSGDLAAAEKAYSQALHVFREVQDLTNEASILFGLGKLKLDQGKSDQAGYHLKRSIELTEQLRENASSTDLRASFLASVHDRYETYVEWLMQQNARDPGGGFNQRAFESCESGRARSLLDTISGYQKELRASADPALLIEEERLQRDERRLLDRQADIRTGTAPAAAEPEIKSELAKIVTQLASLRAKMSGGSTRAQSLVQVTPVTIDQVKTGLIDADTSIFEYSLGGQVSYLWVIGAGGFYTFELPSKREIEAAARAVIEGMNHHPPAREPQPELDVAIEKLSRMLLGPAFRQMPRSRLIVVADGVLQFVPFQALTDEKKDPLVARYEVINAPSAAMLAALRQNQPDRPVHSKLIAAFGDPVIPPSDAPLAPSGDLSRDARDLQELFYAGQELSEIKKLAGGDIALYSRYDATRARLLETDLSQYQVLHFATHGLLDAEAPERSGLVMSMADRSGHRLNGFVGLADIYRLKAPADLVVLSACYTARGQEVRGEGLVGLTRGFMYAGAPTVVASLWKVDDEASAELMKRFYGYLLVDGMRPSEALRAAQNSIRQQPNWRAPYYWAAFTLQGDFGRPIKPNAAAAQSRYKVFVVIGLGLIVLASMGWFAHRRWRATHKAG